MRTAVVLCFLLAGCVSVQSGQKFDVSAAKQIQPNVSTKADVIKLLGPPTNRYDVGGVERWTYSYFGVEAHPTAIAFIPYAGPFIPGASASTATNDNLTIGFSGEVVSSCVISTTTSTGSGSAVNQSAAATSETVDCQKAQ